MPTLLSTSTPPRPFLKWAGGKGQLIQQYLAHFPKDFSTYYEPFLGGGAIFFHLQPRQSVLSDINAELVNVYCCIRDRVEELIELLQQHQQRHCREYYYQMRAFTSSFPLEKAARLIYLNKTCFNGLYRENSRGQFNVPMGQYKAPKICHPELLRSVSQSLQSTRLVVRPFDAVLDDAIDDRTFVYFDPPYHPISATSRFTAYNRYSFHASDQVRLRDTFVQLANRGINVMLSNSDCPFIRELYQDFTIHPIAASRSINSNPQRRGKITELLITSYSG
jgi:DNA adenine methylase